MTYPKGFIILRHVNNEKTNQYWIECYESIRKLYEDPIIIIDDNSNYNYITPHETVNCRVINSEYKGRGEILPYYYLYKDHLFENSIILHDSTFITQYINFEDPPSNIRFLWTFEHRWNNPKTEIYLLYKLRNPKFLQYYVLNHVWNGCFGCQSCISFTFIQQLQEKYNLFYLLNIINNRSMRMAFERVFGLLCHYEDRELLKHSSYFGKIHQYMKWGYTYEEYVKEKDKNENKLDTYKMIKIWTGR